MSGISDSFQRPISYLRISVTDRCNLRCVYCMPPEGIPLIPHADILRYEEILSVVRVAAGMGINRIRLSGGEPLARAGLADFVRMLSEVREIDDLSLTTNGVLLKDLAAGLKTAGLKRVNISLDSLKRSRFKEITGHDRLPDVLEGIKAAEAAGLAPIKINVVVMRGVNEDELLDFAKPHAGWLERPFHRTHADPEQGRAAAGVRIGQGDVGYHLLTRNARAMFAADRQWPG